MAGTLLYRCRMCGKLKRSIHVPDPGRALASIVADGRTPQDQALTARITDIHDCGFGRTGIADLIGMVPDEPTQSDGSQTEPAGTEG